MRDFSSISPSAKSVLAMRSQTSIPYARQAAELLWGAAALDAALARAGTMPKGGLDARHFEDRYRSIDLLLRETSSTQVVELASGLSFRGLDAVSARANVVFFDTDLAPIVELKRDLMTKLRPGPLAGILHLRPLDVQDVKSFQELVAEVPEGPVTIINEGLLVYFDDEEKALLARSVRQALKSRGGMWIVGDIYLRKSVSVAFDERDRRFQAERRVNENSFASWETADRFFTEHGFHVERRVAPSDAPHHTRETWMLSAR